MMDEYITRNNAISAVCFGCNQQFSNEPCEPSECSIRQSIMALPTADVVPKSEVDKLNKELDNLAEELSDLIVEKDKLFDEVVRLRTVLDEYEETSGLKKAKAEVAREVLQEFITELRKNYVNVPILKKNLDEIAKEIEKKYTENKE